MARRILLIDRQEYWRKLSAHALSEAGFAVSVLGSYSYSPDTAYFEEGPPDIVIIGCLKIGHEEQQLIVQLLADKHRVVVLGASLPWNDMRSLFLAGADDVADKTYDGAHLVRMVEEALGLPSDD